MRAHAGDGHARRAGRPGRRRRGLLDADELDPVGFAAERLFSGCCQPQLEACEVLAVAERALAGVEGRDGQGEDAIEDEAAKRSLLSPQCFEVHGPHIGEIIIECFRRYVANGVLLLRASV